jgi:hypothetical protein
MASMPSRLIRNAEDLDALFTLFGNMKLPLTVDWVHPAYSAGTGSCRLSTPLSRQATIGGSMTRDAYECGFVEYRSLAHALWKESLSIIRTWRFGKRNNLDVQQWYGVYLKGTEIRAAAMGPWQIDNAFTVAAALNASVCVPNTPEGDG